MPNSQDPHTTNTNVGGAADTEWFNRASHQPSDISQKVPAAAPAPAVEGAPVEDHEVERHSTATQQKRPPG